MPEAPENESKHFGEHKIFGEAHAGNLAHIAHPRKLVVPLAVGLSWGHDGAIYQAKLDGEFMTRTVPGGGVLLGEQMRSGQFIAWDCAAYDYADVRHLNTVARGMMRDALCRAVGVRVVESSPDGGELLQRVLVGGGEGIVRKLPDATYYDAMEACKRLHTWLCRVVALNHATGGASTVDAATGEARGTVPLRNRAGQCRVGSIVKVEGLELHAGGKIRDPRPCKDTEASWLVRF